MSTFSSVHAREIDLAKVQPPQNGQGIVLVSLTVSGLENQLYASFGYQEPNEPANKAQQIVVGRPFFSSNEAFSSVDGRWGRLVALQLPAGKHLFGESTAWVVQGQAGTIRTQGNLNRSFEVLPNKVVYLGNLDIFPRFEPSFKTGQLIASMIIGLTGGPIIASSNGASVVYDQWSRDSNFLKSVNPSFDTSQVLSRPMIEDRDERVTAFAKMLEEKALKGDSTAQAVISQAKVLGAAELPDYRVLRMPARGNFDAANFEAFLNAAGPSTLLRYMQMNAAAATPVGRVPLSPEVNESMVHRAAFSYQSNAVQSLLLRLRRSNQESEAKAWDARARRVGYKLGSSEAQVSALAGLQTFQQYEQLQAERKALFLSVDGQAHLAKDDGKAPLEQFLVQSSQACEQQHGSACALHMINRWNVNQAQGSCSSLHMSQGIANQFPPTSYVPSPETATSAVTATWAKTFAQWVESAAAHQAFPRSFVWDGKLNKGFGTYGDCSSALRAVLNCQKEGGTACDLVVQDDKLVEGTDFAKEMMSRINNYQAKRPVATLPQLKVSQKPEQ